jgi:hypothetical protein
MIEKKVLEKILKKYQKELDAIIAEQTYLTEKQKALEGIVVKITDDLGKYD